MKTFISLALTLVLSTSLLVGCGCTNQNMDTTSAPTVLPTNEEIWDSTENTTRHTTETTTMTETTDATTTTDSTDTSRNVNETEVQNHVNDYSNMVQEQMKKDKEAKKNTETNSSRMVPGTR